MNQKQLVSYNNHIWGVFSGDAINEGTGSVNYKLSILSNSCMRAGA